MYNHRPNSRGRQNNNRERTNAYEEHWPQYQVHDGLQTKQLFSGFICLTYGNDEAYVTLSNGIDVLISDMKDRNRAFHGDEVAVQIYPQDQWMVNLKELMNLCSKLPRSDEKVRILQSLADHPGNI
ncbi:hypothetical protein Btru_023781 [Bulinus truncatus]|nr:hypothetical protein Btru_023781 [Bulinus truncatus]